MKGIRNVWFSRIGGWSRLSSSFLGEIPSRVSLFSIYRMETKTNDHTKKQQDCLSHRIYDGNIRSKKKRLRHKSFLLSSSLFIFYLFYLFVLLEFEGRVYQGQFCHVLKPLNTRKKNK